MAKGRKNKNPTIVVTPPTTNKTLKNRRRRLRRKVIAKSAGRSMRSMRKWPQTKDGATFLRAALDPFSDVQLRSVGVPDVFAGDTLKHCNTMEVVVVPDNTGNITFTILPSVSDPLIMLQGLYKDILVPQCDKTTFAPVGTQVLPSFDASSGEGYLAALSWPQWASYYGSQGTTTTNPYNPYGYRSQRIVSMGLEWRYTGTELSDQGVCTAAITDAYMIDGQLDYTGTAPVVAKSSHVNFVCKGECSTFQETTAATLSNVPGYRQLSMHSAEGAGGMLVLVAAEEGYIMKPYVPNAVLGDNTAMASAALTLASTTIATLGTTNDTTVAYASFPISPWQNLRPITVNFSGMKTDGSVSVVLKLKQRVEATIDQASPFAQFIDKSPMEDCAALELVADIQKTLPVMVPVTMNGFGDWWRKIMGTIGSVGRIVGGIGLPVVSPIAGAVSGLADVLGAL